jgi:hypothetical protein
MVVASFERNFIFLKSRKTGGTSMEIALSPYAGKDGIITPLAAKDEAIRFALSPDALPRNYADDPAQEEAYRAEIRRSSAGVRGARKQVKPHYKFYNHIPARLLRERLPAEFWAGAVKFTIERHPYEKAVSFAYSKLGKKGRTDIGAVLDEVVEHGGYANFDIYTIDGELAVDFVIRYEDVERGIRKIERRCDIDIRSHMPQAKANSRTDHRPAAEILSESQKEAVRARCEREFELFGYEA